MNKLLIAGAVGVGALMVIGRKKYQEVGIIVDSMEINIRNIRDFNIFAFPEVTFRATIDITNHSDIDFGSTLSSQLKIVRVRAYTARGELLGVADANSTIVLPARQTASIDNVAFAVDATAALEDVVANFSTYVNSDFSMLHYEVDVSAFGKTVTVNA